MTQYKLSYNVNNDKVEVIANSEIDLAASILDMEKDVGLLCFNVKIEQGRFSDDIEETPEPFYTLKRIIQNCEILRKAIHIKK